MPRPRVLVLRSPGANCVEETAFAFERAGADADRIHINRLLEEPALTQRYQILCVPGGFTYGDDVAAGKILGIQIRQHLAECLGEFKQADKLILGICNGFQVLIKSGILLAPDAEGRDPATLTWNDSGKFEDRWVWLRTGAPECVFLRQVERLYLPVAHAEGKVVLRDEATLEALREGKQIALRYAHGPSAEKGGLEDVPYPENPNGSVAAIAGICDETGRVLGLMPHPERYIDRTQHPRWTREKLPPEGDGFQIFRNAVHYFK